MKHISSYILERIPKQWHADFMPDTSCRFHCLNNTLHYSNICLSGALIHIGDVISNISLILSDNAMSVKYVVTDLIMIRKVFFS